jgi:prolyl-tRNA synthetase
MAETLKMLEVYREFAETVLAMPVIAGEKPANERFPGAEATYSIEAMMQDGKALQAGTSHYLGTSFAEAANIRFQDREGGQQFAHTTSWGVSTRMVGGMIMTHGDDDGLRVPPAIAPFQVVILPMLRDNEGDAALLEYCEGLRAALAEQTALREPLRVLLDSRAGKATQKRWGWVKKGVPLILEIGGRDAENGQVSVLRRHRLYNEAGKADFHAMERDQFIAAAATELECIQRELHEEARERRDSNIRRDIATFDELAAFYAEDACFPGWVELAWSRPEGAELEAVDAKLKALKLTIRNTPLDGAPVDGTCPFTGKPAVERIYVARAY